MYRYIHEFYIGRNNFVMLYKVPLLIFKFNVGHYIRFCKVLFLTVISVNSTNVQKH